LHDAAGRQGVAEITSRKNFSDDIPHLTTPNPPRSERGGRRRTEAGRAGKLVF